jgi:hypothetical protein
MTKKIAVSLPDGTWARAKAVVRNGRAESVSGYIARLIDREAEEESFEEMIARWNREDGRAPEAIERGRAIARADFEQAGLIAKDTRRGKTRR